MESTRVQPLHTAEPVANASTDSREINDTEPTGYNSPSVALLPPNDASVITLLAAQAKDDHELQAQLRSSTLIEPGALMPRTASMEELTGLNGFILSTHQRLQEQHGLKVDPAIYDPTRNESWVFGADWGVRFHKSYIALKTIELLQAIQRSERNNKPFPFARLPLELREEVYRHALAGDCKRILVQSTKTDGGVLSWYDWNHPHLEPRRSRYRSTRIGFGMGINTAILRTSKAVHVEAEHFLYQLHEFDFALDVSGVLRFLQSLSDHARQNITGLTVHLINTEAACIGPPGRPGHRKAILAMTRPSTGDWGLACSYIAQNLRLQELAFRLESEVVEDFQHLSWVQDMVQIKGLKKLTYYERYQRGWREHWRINDVDGSTTDSSDRNHALVFYLRSQMLDAAITRCLRK